MLTTADTSSHVSTIGDAIARMKEIGGLQEIDPENPQPPGLQDGLVCFNHLYCKVTERIALWLEDGRFRDGAFMNDLDVAFANRYFEAIAAWEAGRYDDVPRSWAALLDRRLDQGVDAVRFAAAGVSAHINLDLSVALVQTCRKRMCRLVDLDDRHHDFEEINTIFGELFAALREDLTAGRFEHIDRGPVEELADRGSYVVVDKARDFAWMMAKSLHDRWEREGDEGAARFERVVDSMVGAFGRMIV